jgi:hypothetical protein
MRIVARALRRTAVAPRPHGGMALALLGAVADGAIGLSILNGAAAWLLLLHIPAALLWAEGISRIAGWSHCRAISRWLAGRRVGNGVEGDAGPLFHGRTVMLSLIGLLLFPGGGTLGCTIAVCLSSLRLMARHQRAAPPTEIGGDALPILTERPTDPLHDLSIEPLVDILRERDNPLRHAAIRLLGRRCDRESVALLRGLLTDPDPDIRSEASTTLFNFEMQLNRTLNDAIARVRSAPQEADAYADLGITYCRFVGCGLLDGPSARLYLTRACTALREATTLAPESMDYWLALAGAERDLGEIESAARSVARARALSPDDAEAHLLAMDLAFREQRWADLVAYSASGEGRAPDAPEIAELAAWWAVPVSDRPAPVEIRRGAVLALVIPPEHEGVA